MKAAPVSARNEITMMAIIASYFLNDNWFTSAALSMIAVDVLVKLNLTHLTQVKRAILRWPAALLHVDIIR